MGRLRLGRLLAIGTAGCLLQSAVHLPNSAHLQSNRPIFVLESCLRLGWPTRLHDYCSGRSGKIVKEIKAGEYLVYPRDLRPATKLICMYQMERGGCIVDCKIEVQG